MADKRTGYHHGNLRDHLISATRALIETKRPEYFKVADACRHAGVSTAAPYRHFADRKALLDAVAIAGFHDLREVAWVAGSQHTKGSVDAVSAIGKAYVEFACRESNLFRLMFGQSGSDDETKADTEGMSSCEIAGRACYEVLLEQLVVTLARDSIDEQVIEAAFPLWTFVHGLSFLLIDGNLSVNRMPIDVGQQIDRATIRLMPTSKKR